MKALVKARGLIRLAALAALAALGALAGCAPAPARPVLSGRIDAAALAPLPAEAPIALAPAEDQAGGEEIARLAARLLAARGHPVEADAAYTLALHVIAVPAAARARLPDVGLAGVIGSSGTRDVGVSIGLPLFGLGDARERRWRYAVEAELRGPDQALVWRGRVDGIARTGAHARIAARALPPLFDRLGRPAHGDALPPA